MNSGYNHFTETEREHLYELLDTGMRKSDIGDILGKDRSAVYREIKRNVSRVGYLPDKANSYYLSRRGKTNKLSEDIVLQGKVIKMLKDKLSPKQIILTFKKQNGVSPISAESIYQFIYSAKGKELELYKYLRRKHKKRKIRKGKVAKKISIPNRTPIIQRPEEINNREWFWHWEGDLMIFSYQRMNLITLRERISRVIIIIINKTKESEGTAKNIISKFKGDNKELFSSCTFDNGGEFAQHEKIAKALDAQTYFCDPYASYQKGSVEQGNGVIRAELPRHTNLENISQKEINALARNINNRPMELHDGLSPSEVFMKMSGNRINGFVALQT